VSKFIFTMTGEVPVGGRDGLEKRLPVAVRLLWPQVVDYSLYADSDQGDEDQSTGHRLVAGV
jgi:hypothetical protein